MQIVSLAKVIVVQIISSPRPGSYNGPGLEKRDHILSGFNPLFPPGILGRNNFGYRFSTPLDRNNLASLRLP